MRQGIRGKHQEECQEGEDLQQPATCTTQLRTLPRLGHARSNSLILALSPSVASRDSLLRPDWWTQTPHGFLIGPHLSFGTQNRNHQLIILQSHSAYQQQHKDCPVLQQLVSFSGSLLISMSPTASSHTPSDTFGLSLTRIAHSPQGEYLQQPQPVNQPCLLPRLGHARGVLGVNMRRRMVEVTLRMVTLSVEEMGD